VCSDRSRGPRGSPHGVSIAAGTDGPPGALTAGELFPAISDFRGSLSVTSSAAIAAMTLRQNSAPLSYTTLPVVPRSTPAQDLLLPHIADGAFSGGKMRTSFILLNPAASEATIALSLTKDDGSPGPSAWADRPRRRR